MPCLVSLVLPQDLTKQLDEVTQNSEIVEIRQKEAECELEAARDRVQQQATEILLKASKTLSSSPLLPSFFPSPVASCITTRNNASSVSTHERIKPIPTDPLLLSVESSPWTLQWPCAVHPRSCHHPLGP